MPPVVRRIAGDGQKQSVDLERIVPQRRPLDGSHTHAEAPMTTGC
jgi:hypothetical protein